MPRGRSLTSPETGAGVWCFFAPMQELTLEHEEMSDAVCVLSVKQHCIVGINPAHHPLPSISSWPIKRKLCLRIRGNGCLHFGAFLSIIFSEYVPKLECRVSPSVVHIHPGAERQEEDQQLPSQTAFKGFCRSLTVGRERWKREVRVNGKQVRLSDPQQERSR